jgi:predicted RNA-binding Zn ribbon-like protein
VGHVLPDPGDRSPAPAPLRTVQAFVNTLDRENGIEELATPAALSAALARAGAADGAELHPDERDLAWAIEVREALRSLLLANVDPALAVAAGDRATLRRAASAAHVTLGLEPGGPLLVPQAGGLDGALGRVVAVAATAIADGSWARLKACPRDVCGWVFYDRSRNRSSRWCAMSVCGNRTKARVYRHRAAG